MTSFPVITIKIAITPLLNYVTKTRVSIYFLMFQSLSIKKLYLSDNYVTGIPVRANNTSCILYKWDEINYIIPFNVQKRPVPLSLM